MLQLVSGHVLHVLLQQVRDEVFRVLGDVIERFVFEVPCCASHVGQRLRLGVSQERREARNPEDDNFLVD